MSSIEIDNYVRFGSIGNSLNALFVILFEHVSNLAEWIPLSQLHYILIFLWILLIQDLHFITR